MADRVLVIEPVTGTILSVDSESPQAKSWKRAEPERTPARKPAKKEA